MIAVVISVFLWSAFSNVPSSPACGVFVSRLVRYAGACSSCGQFLGRGRLLADRLVERDYQRSRLGSSFRKFYGRCGDLVGRCSLPLGRVLADDFHTTCLTIIDYLIVCGLLRFLFF